MKKIKRILLILLLILLIGFLIPQSFTIPVKGASKKSYNQQSFWAYPWGTSITHKGVDIFAKEGTEIVSSTSGIVLYTGTIEKGGNIVLILGPKWRLHYYAHLKEIKTSSFAFVSSTKTIGTVGTTGNAAGKAPHLHYTIKSLIPLPWRKDTSIQGWKKMYYLNPVEYLNTALN
ncbi:M23 family metallopeptidase [Lacibacter luteus]|uniref:M23 family metallopeptidase n=1 Tax=Lacibacter luteus TaxID=2508719 RepID=A0A4Q1CNL0_9BACT|nr:M23 family metallopeptidase [Lacibacter luteus]RXK62676.1 M23 family metallopeptidase [Lacibacter luteus]